LVGSRSGSEREDRCRPPVGNYPLTRASQDLNSGAVIVEVKRSTTLRILVSLPKIALSVSIRTVGLYLLAERPHSVRNAFLSSRVFSESTKFPLSMLHQQPLYRGMNGRRFVLTATRPRFLGGDSRVSAGEMPPEGEPLLCGGGEDSILCGECRFVLAVAVDFRRLATELFLRCPHCGCDNELG
jgi:hypothetical protein